jgi:hypothetical protein
MVKIIEIEHIQGYVLSVKFDDGSEKQIDFGGLITFDGIAAPLKDLHYFRNVSILRNGRSFGWDNGYDCCADWAYTV